MGLVPEPLLSQLKERYAEPQRFYHTWAHIEALLDHFAGIEAQLNDPDAVLLALYWHDAIYDPKAADNEEQSASLLLAQAKGQVSDERLAFAAAIVRATAKHLVPEGLSSQQQHDLELFLDIDLSILAAPEPIFFLYEADIQKEYAFVPADLYRQARSGILAGFLNRDRLYFSDHYHYLWESRARDNLQNSIRSLAGTE